MSETHSAEPAELPPELRAAAARADGQIVIVMGAGCSLDPPTSLELAGDLANRICSSLIANGSLPPDMVDDPRDLSQLASAVFELTGSQRLVVDEFPPAAFRSAQPNEGHITLAALMREGVVGNTLSLNFDLSVSSAISITGAGLEVRVLKGPEDHAQQGERNLIYLHRNIESGPDELILRTEQLESEWKARWEEVVARRLLSGPLTVFVGLGSPAGVLTETAKWIMRSLDAETVYVVGPVTGPRSSVHPG
jgi:hypothetical protein